MGVRDRRNSNFDEAIAGFDNILAFSKGRRRPSGDTEDDFVDVREIELSRIHVKSNPRKEFKNIDELAATIDAVGLINPITVRLRAEDDDYELVAGERRFRAVKKLRKKSIPAYVKGVSELPNDRRSLVQIVENLQRDDIPDGWHALALLDLKNEAGTTNDELGRAIGKSAGWVKKKIKHAEILNAIAPEGPTSALASLGTSIFLEIQSLPLAKQRAALKKALSGATVSEVRAGAKGQAKPAAKSKFRPGKVKGWKSLSNKEKNRIKGAFEFLEKQNARIAAARETLRQYGVAEPES